MVKNIALISDIHGNSTALRVVLDEIRKRSEIEHIYCLGDLIGVGHESNEVLEQLFAMQDISIVRGNHDKEIINILKGEENPTDFLIEHHHWIAERIDTKYHDFLFGIPQTIYSTYEDKKFLFAHYRFDEQGNFFPSDPEPTIKKLESYYEKENVDVICFGHHHKVHFFQSEKRTYVNPGPVGLDNFGPIAKYCVIEVGKNVNVSFKEITYDLNNFQRFINTFDTLKVPYGEKLVKSAYRTK